MNLFRKEVLQSKSEVGLGPVALTRSWSSWIISSIVAFSILLTCIYLYFGTYTKRATASGILTPVGGVIRILPISSGMVTQKYVREGQSVKKGDSLFILSDERRATEGGTSLRLADAQKDSLLNRRQNLINAAASFRLSSQQASQGLRNRLNALYKQQKTIQQEVDLHARRIAAGEKSLERHRTLAKEHFISEVALQDKEDQLETLRSQKNTAQRQQDELASNIEAERTELQQIATRTENRINELDRDLNILDQELAEARTKDKLVIAAPIDGTITSINAQLGQSSGTQALAILLPKDSKLIAQLFMPSKSIGFVRAGQEVRVRYQAYPYQKFGQYTGHVAEVSRSPLLPNDLTTDFSPGSSGQEGLYRVTVELKSQEITAHGHRVQLLPGMIVEADIEQEKRTLIEWIFSPLIGLKEYTAQIK